MRGNVSEIYKVYDSPNRELVIPVYQRNYDWGKPQCAQLVEDLVELVKSDREKHFFGSIVGDQEDAWKWVVIDGQQRLTTVSILILALSHLSDAGAIPTHDPDLGPRLRQSYLLKDENSKDPKFRLKPVKDDNVAYQRLFGEEEHFIESSNITANYRYFMQQLPKTELSADEIWQAVRGLEVMWLDLERDDDPQRIFESLNSTGLELTEADKVRNLVLMGLPTHEQEAVYEEYWNRIEKNVNYATDGFLRWYLVTKTTRTPRRSQVYDAFKTYAKKTGLKGAALLADVRDYSVHYREILHAKTGVPDADRRLARLNIVQQEVILPLLMPLLAEYRAGTVSSEDFSRSVTVIDTYIFRRFVCGYATNALNKIFATAYREITRMRRNGDQFSDVLIYSLSKRTGSGYFPDDDRFFDDFATRDFYNISKNRRTYLFECLENGMSQDNRDIAGALTDGNISIEHIMPQTLTPDWRRMLGEEAEEVHREWLHRIGNLTVTGYNSSYSNQSFNVKKTTENGFDDTPYRINRYIIESDQWTKTEIQHRSEKLAALAMKYWPYPETAFEPPQVELPSEPLGETGSFTGQAIAAYEFLQGQRTVASWKELVVRVLQELESVDRNGLIDAAGEFPYWFRIDGQFSGQTTHFEKISPGLEVTLESSTRSRVNMLRRLFEAMRLDPEELVLKFRAPAHEEPITHTEAAESEFAALTKFIPVLEPLVGLKLEESDVDDLIEELNSAISDVSVEGALEILGEAPALFAESPEKIAHASSEQIRALLTVKQQENQLINPHALHSALADGSILAWLRRLSEVDHGKSSARHD